MNLKRVIFTKATVPPRPAADLETSLRALGAEVDRVGAMLLLNVSPRHAMYAAAIEAFHPQMPNAEVPPVNPPTWEGVSTEDRISYEVDRLAALRRVLAAGKP